MPLNATRCHWPDTGLSLSPSHTFNWPDFYQFYRKTDKPFTSQQLQQLSGSDLVSLKTEALSSPETYV